MGRFPTVVIDPAGAGFRVAQGGRDLLRVPAAVLEAYEADCVFPPEWGARGGASGERRLFWHPETLEYLMAAVEAHPVRVVEALGSEPYRSYLQGFWLPRFRALVLRIYWNPADPLDPFGEEARRESLRVQLRFLELLRGLRPPARWTAVLNATEAYLDAVGLNGADGLDPETIRELSLTPPVRLATAEGARALELVGTRLASTCFPVLDEETLRGAYALSLQDLHTAEACLADLGLLTKEGAYEPH
ncbi:MAG: hypothetical protein HY900_17475 [Deltaproteobacteria bacterium]|nr:hypothetical protein [Deltaproteobacteria bacterium]